MNSSDSTRSPRILRVARTDEPDASVLLHVSSSGPDPLDVRIVATEGENPYLGSVKRSRLRTLRAKNYRGSDEEWTQIVSYVLGKTALQEGDSASLSGVTVTATLSGATDEGKEISLSIRKKIESITQRLGSISLKQDDEQAIELFEWCNSAVERTDALQEQVSSLTERCRTAEDTIQKLHDQLEELLNAKSQHEAKLMYNFVQLLNEKKLKIRNQQRLLATSTPDPVKVSEIKATTSGRQKSSSRSKRRARAVSEDESEDGLERMDVDQAAAAESPQATDEDQPSTPQPLEAEEETATSDEDLEQPSIADAASQQRPASKPPSVPPPRRELPFAKQRAQRTDEEQPAGPVADETAETGGETDDDEL